MDFAMRISYNDALAINKSFIRIVITTYIGNNFLLTIIQMNI